jgi:hypothetical protein
MSFWFEGMYNILFNLIFSEWDHFYAREFSRK